MLGKSCATRLKSNSNSHVYATGVWSTDRIVQRQFNDQIFHYVSERMLHLKAVWILPLKQTLDISLSFHFQNETNGNLNNLQEIA